MKNTTVGIVILAIIAVILIVYFSSGKNNKNPQNLPNQTSNSDYNPQIVPADFTTNITNQFFKLPVGRKLHYEEQTADGLEKIVIEIMPQTRILMGVNTILYHDTVTVDAVVVEDTKDYLAQDKAGNVWYFGEEVDNYENGKLKDHAGSWLAGTDGAKPGIWIKGEHKVGDSYRQEYYKGQAEDMRDVVAVNQTVTTKLKTYTDCVKVYDWTPLDSKSKENKYYCPEVGALVVNENVTTSEKAELVKVEEPK